MPEYLGDFAQDKTVHVYVRTTVDGVPTAPSSALEAADVRIYKNADAAQKATTNGITLTSPFDSLTGLHVLAIDTSNDTGDAGFWATASDYTVVLEPDETLGGVAFGGIVAQFSIENRSALRPTVADRTLDVSAGGEAAPDWANIGSPTTVVNLSGTTVKTATDVETDTAEIGAAGAGLTNINLPNQTMDIVGNITGNLSGSVGSVTAGVTLAASAVQAIWDALTSALTTVGSIGKLLVDNINATISSRSSHSAADVWASVARTLTAATNITSTGGTTVPQTGDSFARLGAPAGASIAADLAEIEGQTDDIGAAGVGLTAIPWNAAWDPEVQSEVADALEATIADSIPADGTAPSVKQALYMLTQFMLERAVSSTTVTVKKPDGSTSLFTLTLNDGTTPTSITRAT